MSPIIAIVIVIDRPGALVLVWSFLGLYRSVPLSAFEACNKAKLRDICAVV